MSIFAKPILIVGAVAAAFVPEGGAIDSSVPGAGQVYGGVIASLHAQVATVDGLEAAIFGQVKAGAAVPKTEDDTVEPDPAAKPPAAQPRRRLMPRPIWDMKHRTGNTRRVEAALDEVTEVSFTDNPLEEALSYLEDLHQIEIWIDKQVLTDEGFNIDTPVTLQISGVALKDALEMLLEPLALDYVIKNDVLKITTRAKADEMFEIRVYDVSRLKDISVAELEQIIRATVSPSTWISCSANDAVAATPPGATGTNGPTDAAPAAERTLTTSKTMPAVTSGSAGATPEAALTKCAAGGSIRSTKRALVIRQTQRIHGEIVDLLEQLEQTMTTPDKEPAVKPQKK